MSLELFLSIVSVVGVICALLVNVGVLKKNHDDTVRHQQQIDDNIKELTKRVDEHNNYAKMFQEATNDIAFIKGKMEGI